jgi:phosphate transport system substrate-binding protein
MMKMKKMNGKLIGRLMVAAVILGVLTCSLVSEAASGMLKIKGSDTVLPLSAAWAEAYMKKHPDTVISVTGGGSGTGIAALINGTADIANASREAKPKEISQARDRNVILKPIPVAKDGVAVIVNPKNNIQGLTMAQLAKIYSGAASWKEFGGEDMKIVACGRDSSSGTYVYFQDTVLGGRRYRTDMLTLPSNNAICQTVAQDKGAIGYVGLAYAKEFVAKNKVKIIPINGVVASDETVISGKYPLWRPLYCYTNGKAKGLAADFLKFALSAEGQSIVEKVGYVAISR